MSATPRPATGPAVLAPVSAAQWRAALLDPRLPCPAGLRAPDGCDPAARLAVHRNNLVGGLVEVLAANFPVVRAHVGAEFFHGMAARYVRHRPPRDPVLAFYGGAGGPAGDPDKDDASLAAFIDQFPPAAAAPGLGDLARLEALRTRACHAADAEPLTADAGLAAMACGDRIGALRLDCQPSLALLRSRHAVVSLWAAHQAEEPGQRDALLEAVDIDQAEAALVLRPAWTVEVVPLPVADAAGLAAFIAALRGGAGLADAAALALLAQPAFDLRSALALLVSRQALRAIHLP